MRKNHATKKILLVEDDEATRLLITDSLEILKVPIFEFRLGSDAISFYKHHCNEIDLVLLDIILPDKSGWELIKLFREKNPSLSVIAVSAIIPNELARKSMEAGFNAYVSKPFNIENLRKLVDSYL